jgi:hypothetical protein
MTDIRSLDSGTLGMGWLETLRTPIEPSFITWWSRAKMAGKAAAGSSDIIKT